MAAKPFQGLERRPRWVLLGVALLAAVAVAGLVTGELVGNFQSKTLAEAAEAQSRKISALFSTLWIDAVISEDVVALEPAVAQVGASDPEIVSVTVENENGERLAGWRRRAGTAAARQTKTFARDVTLDGELFGRIRIVRDFTDAQARIAALSKRVRVSTGLVFLALLAVVLVIYYRLAVLPLKALNRQLADNEVRLHRAIGEQKRLGQRLRQAEKMEALGKLTSGVAHEFNNLLFAMTANLESLRDELKDLNRPAERARNALKMAFRGAELTDRLLAYVGRQTLNPMVTDVNDVVVEAVELLRAMLGETYAIEAEGGDGLWPVLVDAGELETALINLATNARDAMPEGGPITLATANVRLDGSAASPSPPAGLGPGDYVTVSVRDAGVGMAPAIAEQATDPFFTTKEAGKGTGLGLSMVYGFVRQSGGSVQIESGPGRGTSVTLYLPRADADRRANPAAAADGRRGTGRGALVIVDDPAALDVAVKTLQGLGHRVTAAKTGFEALESLRRDGAVDLLVSDVVLADGMSGVELARAAREKGPSTGVIFMTAYSEEVLAAEGVSETDCRVLRKPVAEGDLVSAVAESLGERAATA